MHLVCWGVEDIVRARQIARECSLPRTISSPRKLGLLIATTPHARPVGPGSSDQSRPSSSQTRCTSRGSRSLCEPLRGACDVRPSRCTVTMTKPSPRSCSGRSKRHPFSDSHFRNVELCIIALLSLTRVSLPGTRRRFELPPIPTLEGVTLANRNEISNCARIGLSNPTDGFAVEQTWSVASSIPSFCRRSAQCRPPRPCGYGVRRRLDDWAAHRAYRASAEHCRY